LVDLFPAAVLPKNDLRSAVWDRVLEKPISLQRLERNPALAESTGQLKIEHEM